MIILMLKPGLGNQLFQYAAVRTQAERMGVRLYCTGVQNFMKDAFGIGPGKLSRKISWRLLGRVAKHIPHEFKPGYKEYAPGVWGEIYNPELSEIRDCTLVDGYYQTDAYFRDNREAVLRWFTPLDKHNDRIDEILDGVGAPVEKLCVIHVRLQDYGDASMGLGTKENGWILPRDYYLKALERMPEGLQYIILSDDPERARSEYFPQLKGAYFSEGENHTVDMMLLSRSRYVIASNSTFAWWGAWLNNLKERMVYMPEFFLGWNNGFWYPDEIRVEGWHYIPCAVGT